MRPNLRHKEYTKAMEMGRKVAIDCVCILETQLRAAIRMLEMTHTCENGDVNVLLRPSRFPGVLGGPEPGG